MFETGFVKENDMDLFRCNMTPCITKTPDGDLLCAFGTGNVASYELIDTGHEMIAISRSTDGGRTWSTALPFFSTPGRAHGDPNFVWTDHGLQCYVTTNTGRYPECLANNTTFRRESLDNGRTWGAMIEINFPIKYMCGNIHHGLRLADGSLIMGYTLDTDLEESDKAPEGEGTGNAASGLLRSTDDGYTWTAGPALRLEEAGGVVEPAYVELADGEVFALFRSTSQRRKFYEARTSDGGRTWTDFKASRLTSYNTPASLLKLQDGSVMAVWDNNDTPDRWPLCAAVSKDGCRTWSEPKAIDETKAPVAYPSAVQLEDGTIVVVYWHLWGPPSTTPWPPATIRYARFDRDWL